jgi:multicomponent Na+:H+ antiporter subunit F
MLNILLTCLTIATAPVLYRLVRGPSIADRVAAFDVLNCIVIGILGVFAIRTESIYYIDVVLTMSFVVFLGTVAFAFYLSKKKN